MKFLNKTIEYGLYLLVFILPLQTRWIIKAGFTEYSTYSLYGTDILLILLLVLFIIVISIRQLAKRNPLDSENLPLSDSSSPAKCGVVGMTNQFIGGLLLTSMVSVFFAVNKPLALYKLGWLILGAGLFWLVVRANYGRLKLIYFMLAGMFLQAVLGSWQFLSQSSFANKWLGLALHNGADLGASVVEAVGADGIGERWLRAYGGLDHPNMLGGLMAIGILLAVYLSLVDICHFDRREKSLQHSIFTFKRFLANARNDTSQTVLTPLLKGLIIIFTAALFFSFSRSAWLGLAVALAVMMVLAVVGKNLKQQRSLAEIILVMGILLFVLFSQYQNLITSRLGGEGRLENKSTSERLVSYQESWQMIKNNWATGAGLGNYTLALSRQAPNQESFYYQPAHNVFMLVWAEVGIVGLLFFIGLLFVIASDRGERGNLTYSDDNQRLLRRYAPRNDSVILIALVVVMSLDHWLFSLHFGVLFFWLVLGVMASGGRDETDAEKIV